VTGEDAIELMMAGASLIGIGTALWERGETIFKLICEEIRLWCDANGVKSLTEIIGGAHPLGKGYLKHSSATT
jgi:dihydroorotate dehydrogenase (NAD+) catalytic subunit